MSKIKLLLVDDHDIVRAGLRMLFEAEADIEIVGEAASGAQTLEILERVKPDVVLMDVVMDGMNGINTTRHIKSNYPTMVVLGLTMHEDQQYLFEMLRAGAAGYVPKRAAPDDLVNAIHVVHRGDVFLYPPMAKLLVNGFLDRDIGATSQSENNAARLTRREKEVLIKIAEGYTNRHIAELLSISIKTVDRHRENIMGKLDIHNRVDLVKYAIGKGLIAVD